jgi:ABC-type branched-subunit amino acid transport system ATPase component
VEITRALALKPEMLLLDEAVAGLNRPEINEVSSVLKGLSDIGITILLIEHNMEFIMNISDRVSVLNFGSKIAEGSPQEVQEDKKVIEAYLGRGDLCKNLEQLRLKES